MSIGGVLEMSVEARGRQPVQPVHPLVACADAVEAALTDVATVDPGYLPTSVKAEVLRRLDRLETRLAAVRLRVMAGAEDVAESTADHSVATWLAVQTRTDPRERAGELALARALDRSWVRLGVAVAQGEVNLAQARVIVHALEDLPVAEVGQEGLARAEEALVGFACEHAPRALRRLGRRIWEVAAPDAAEEAEGKALEREERRADAVTSLSFHRLGDGTTRLSGRLPDLVADRLRTYLDAYTSPRHRGLHGETGPADGDGPADRVPPRRRLGQAFAAFLEAADPDRIPLHGGDATTVLVTIDLATLQSQLAGVGLVADEPVSAAQARRLACGAQIIPVVLGGKSEILDLGRSRRLFTPAQRKAMAVRDRRCRAEHCQIPAAWCEAHHATNPWTTGGRTDLDDGVLLCSWHHHRAHDPTYHTRRLPNGDYQFHRRT
jgi:hypothetical protein